MNNKLFNRKSPRLLGYDYSDNGFYFITICTVDRGNFLSKIVDDRLFLSNIGYIVKNITERIHIKYPTCNVIKYVIMPNHIHLLISLNACHEIGESSPKLSTIIGWYKYYITKEYNKGNEKIIKIFQRSFNDHIIRNDVEYFNFLKYIEDNPLNWTRYPFYER